MARFLKRIKGKWVLARGLKCLRLKQLSRVGGDRRNISNGERKVCFSPGEGFVTRSVYDRYHLRAGERVPGSALLRSWIIRQFSSTLIVKLELTSLVRFIGEPWPPFTRPVMQHLANSGDSGEANDLSLVL